MLCCTNEQRAIIARLCRTNEWHAISARHVCTNEWHTIGARHVVVEVTSRTTRSRGETRVDKVLRVRWRNKKTQDAFAIKESK